jgi:hypothetical protein
MRRLILLAAALTLSGCVETIAKSRVKTALLGAGLSEPISTCMAAHMVDKLTITQLRKLEAFQGPKSSTLDYIRAVQRINDPEAIRVTVAAAGLCMTGWEK